MGKPFAISALCIISAAFGAVIDHYLAGAIAQSGPHLEQAVSPQVLLLHLRSNMLRCLGIGSGATFDTKS
jgi:hypothetical protein